MQDIFRKKRGDVSLKKYLLLIEDEKLWEKFKKIIDRDINTELINLVKKRVGVEVKNG